jgi:hypothetical protein
LSFFSTKKSSPTGDFVSAPLFSAAELKSNICQPTVRPSVAIEIHPYPELLLDIRTLANAFVAVLLTCWHLIFATILTQILARTSTLLDGRKTVRMTGKVYFRAIVPIGVLYSLSLVCSNLTYLYLSVAFIQMLKVWRRYRTFQLQEAEPNLYNRLQHLRVFYSLAMHSELTSTTSKSCSTSAPSFSESALLHMAKSTSPSSDLCTSLVA